MSNHTYQKIELVGSSTKSIEDAVQNAVAKAALTEKKPAMAGGCRYPRPS
jgi:flavin-binding protein dodecin